MKYLELQKKLSTNIFTLIDVFKLFPEEKTSLVKVQLSRFSQKGLITKIKRSLYCFDFKKIDELELASKLYEPSYISLETALNNYGIIPDIPQAVTSVNLVTTKSIKNQFGVFYYSKISQKLFFGFKKEKSSVLGYFYNLAFPEKALLDYIYFQKIQTIEGLRMDLKEINHNLYHKFAKQYPAWVQKVELK